MWCRSRGHKKLYIGTSGTNLNTRHPVITASMGSTLNSLSEGRFALGLAKGVALRWKAMNVDFPSFEREREFISLMRKLWHGEQVIGHESILEPVPGSTTGAIRQRGHPVAIRRLRH